MMNVQPADAASQKLRSREEGVRIVIAHRLDTVMHCDKIIVLKNGRLLEFDAPGNCDARMSEKRKRRNFLLVMENRNNVVMGYLFSTSRADKLLSNPSSTFARMVHTASMASKTISSNMIPAVSQESLNSESSDPA